jgi:hypothetical protein
VHDAHVAETDPAEALADLAESDEKQCGVAEVVAEAERVDVRHLRPALRVPHDRDLVRADLHRPGV